MKLRKLLVGMVSAAMIMGITVLPSFAEGETVEIVNYTNGMNETTSYRKSTDAAGNILMNFDDDCFDSGYATAEYGMGENTVTFKASTLRKVNDLMRAYWEVNRKTNGCDYNAGMLPENGSGDLKWTVFGKVDQGDYLKSNALILPVLSGGYIFNNGSYTWKNISVSAGDDEATVISNKTVDVDHTFVSNGSESTSFDGIRFEGGFYANPSSTMTFNNCVFTGKLRTANGKGDFTVRGCRFTGEAGEHEYAFFYQAGGTLKFFDNEIAADKYERGLNIDNKDLTATVKDNKIGAVTDTNRSAIQISRIKSINVEDNNININGGNVFTLHSALYGCNSKPEVTIINNNISGSGYLFYDDAKANSKVFDKTNLNFKFYGNAVADGSSIDRTGGVSKDGSVVEFDDGDLLHESAKVTAKIGDDEYADLTDALTDAKDNDTVVLLENINKTGLYFIVENKKITIDLNGKTINAKCSGSAISIYNSDVTVKDTAGNGAIIQSNGNRASAVYATGSTLTLENGKFVSNGEYGAVHTVGSICNISDSTLEGDGGNVAVFEDKSEVQLDDVTLNALFNEQYQMYSDGIYIRKGTTLSINSGSYDGSISAGDTTSKISITGGTFASDVRKLVEKGYVAVSENGKFVVKPSKVTVIDTATSAATTITLNDLEKNLKSDSAIDFDGTEHAVIQVVVSAPSSEDKAAAPAKENESNTVEMYDIKVVKTANGVSEEIPATNQSVTIGLGRKIADGATPIVKHIKNGVLKTISPVTVSDDRMSITFTAPSFSTYYVEFPAVAPTDIAENINISLENEVIDGMEATYDLVISGENDKAINRFMSSEWKFESTGAVEYEIIPTANVNVTFDAANDTYELNMDGKTYSDATGRKIKLATVKITGSGDYTFGVKSAKLHAAEAADSIVTSFDSASAEIVGKAILPAAAQGTLEAKKYELSVNIAFNNAIEDNAAAYQNMQVSISGGDVNETIKLGSDVNALSGNSYTVTCELPENIAYTVTVSGAGYRTARYTVTMTGDKVLNFWNNAKDADTVVEEGNAASARKVTFLAGDIVRDNSINIYDLSAVVSYFGTKVNKDTQAEYAKYDLNRDGVIDSKDVAYVLVSWGK